jgi:hypothetical protein
MSFVIIFDKTLVAKNTFNCLKQVENWGFSFSDIWCQFFYSHCRIKVSRLQTHFKGKRDAIRQ